MVKACHPRVSFAQKLLQFLVQSFIGDPEKSWIPDEASLPNSEGEFGRHYLGNDAWGGWVHTNKFKIDPRAQRTPRERAVRALLMRPISVS